jgi:hypothetical protein
MRDRTGKVVAAGILLWVAAMLLVITTAALAHRRLDDVWMDGLISRVEPKYREIAVWDYQGGVSTWDLTVPGTVDLGELRVGDLVRVRVDRNRRAVLRLYKLPPPKEDDRYWEAVRRLEAGTGSPRR